jgi:hypothetical protein
MEGRLVVQLAGGASITPGTGFDLITFATWSTPFGQIMLPPGWTMTPLVATAKNLRVVAG